MESRGNDAYCCRNCAEASRVREDVQDTERQRTE